MGGGHMKKYCKVIFLSLVLVLVVLSTGCSGSRIESMSNWTFQYNSGMDDYSLFFAFEDKNKNEIAGNANVDIKILDNTDTVLYDKTVSITKDDFHHFSNEVKGEHYLAEIRIPKEEIKKGKSSEGTVRFKVYDKNIEFNECICPNVYYLPIMDFAIEASQLPQEVVINGYTGAIATKLFIEDVEFVVEEGYSPLVNVIVTGKKTYADAYLNSGVDNFAYQVLDCDGYVVESGPLFLTGLNQGDKFKDDTIRLYDLIPGAQYTIKFTQNPW